MKFTEVNTHKLIANLCEEMANEVYEVCASKYDNWYAQNPDRKAFVRQCAPTLKEHARRTLGEMLARNDVPEAEKERIYDALVLDRTIPSTGTWTLPRVGNA